MPTKDRSFNWRYAIGEVILIFIGISLAIGFQNWNDERKLKIEAEQVLQSLRENLVVVSEELDSLRDKELDRIADYEALLTPSKRELFIQQDNVDALIWRRLFSVEVAIPNFTAYEEFKNAGQLSLIKDAELQKMMINLEFQHDDLKTTVADRLFVQQTMMDPILVKYFNVPKFLEATYSGEYNSDLQPTDYSKVLALREVQNAIAYKVALGRDHEEDLARLLIACEKMIKRLDSLNQ